ncbi:MAG: glycosyltransferase family 4 protein [Bacilli bacterium]|nr:glycosyltransferase family 4 protein [Bacilli bacterium]MDY6363055.1 glycosyltransferase family 4 protein [Bacilli bacterium]
MKILMVTQFYYPERFSTTDIAEELVKLGNEVTVLTGKPNYGYGYILKEYKKVKEENINGVRVLRTNLFPRKHSRLSIIRNYLSFHRNAKRKVRSLDDDFDIVLSISLSPVISIAPAIKYAKKHHVPHVLYCQDLWPESTVVTHAVRKNSLVYKILYRWSKSLYEKCDEIIISSPSFKDYFNNVLKISDKKFPVVYQPILNSKENLEPIVYEKKHNFVYAGNIGTLQLTNELVEAMKLLKRDDSKLYLMGMGTNLEKIKKQIKDEHLEDKVEYVGALPIEKAERYYKNADALIVSLKNEGTVGKTIPNKAIQYMKYGRPLIGVIQGDAKELLSKANGTVFADENPQQIADIFEKLCGFSEEEKTHMGTNNMRYFNEFLTAEKLTNQLFDVLKEFKK